MSISARAAWVLAVSLLLAGNYVRAGDCLGCHTLSADKPVHAVLQTAHGDLGGGGAGACAACHGASAEHSANPVLNPPDTSFGPRWAAPVESANGACLGCHAGGALSYWAGSEHQQEDTACNDCHSVHRSQDPALDRSAEAGACAGCHSQTQAQLRLPSRHPIAEGKTACSDCHNPHGSGTEAALREPTLNDQCYSCHQEKRGPHLWEHPPVAEDCSLCHAPHGSVHERLLVTRGPFLCQQCHSAAFHPSLANTGSTLGDRANNQNLLGKNCLNCHSQVHGSNHPSGSRLTR